jgi:hypothetical protein
MPSPMSLWTFVSNALANREARRRRRAVTLYELCVGLEWWLLLQSAWHFRQTATRTSKRWLRGLSWIQLEHVSILYFCLRVVAMMQCGPATPHMINAHVPWYHDVAIGDNVNYLPFLFQWKIQFDKRQCCIHERWQGYIRICTMWYFGRCRLPFKIHQLVEYVVTRV